MMTIVPRTPNSWPIRPRRIPGMVTSTISISLKVIIGPIIDEKILHTHTFRPVKLPDLSGPKHRYITYRVFHI